MTYVRNRKTRGMRATTSLPKIWKNGHKGTFLEGIPYVKQEGEGVIFLGADFMTILLRQKNCVFIYRLWSISDHSVLIDGASLLFPASLCCYWRPCICLVLYYVPTVYGVPTVVAWPSFFAGFPTYAIVPALAGYFSGAVTGVPAIAGIPGVAGLFLRPCCYWCARGCRYLCCWNMTLCSLCLHCC